LRKLPIIQPPHTKLLPPSLLHIHTFTHPNTQPFKHPKRPPTPKPLFLPITKPSLQTQTFLSPASFQETTPLLTHAPIKAKPDDL
ncbi:hypothetical protein, partial [Staphylococcus capitis]|uniref:hypothetical protein n=1 Tax=Staphylococcus capitis TaxID=29388 RepID=UPI001C930001